jgi:hypothetical protein
MSRAPQQQQTFFALFFCVLALLGNTILEWNVDHNVGQAWPHNVLRNWKEFGFAALNGKLVINEGGHDLPENPQIYRGHRAPSLYPAYFMGRWIPGPNVTATPFFFALSALVLFCGILLFDWKPWGFLVSGIAILTPGYLLWPKILDPNTNTILLGIPYAAFVWRLMRQPEWRWQTLVLLTAGTAVFATLNWTTALVHAQLFFYLVARKVPFRRLAAYVIVGVLTTGFVAVSSILAKTNAPAAGAGNGFATIFENYMWGSGGYSAGSSASVLIVRYAFINALALAPLWLVLIWRWLKTARLDLKQSCLVLAPVLVAIGETLAMRNYFCHHPWMAAPALLLGALLSLSLTWADNRSEIDVKTTSVRTHGLALAALCLVFCFSFAVILLQRVNNVALNSMVAFIRSATMRSDVILVSPATDPSVAAEIIRYREFADRWFDTTDAIATNKVRGSVFLLSSQKPGADWTPVAETSVNRAAAQGPVEKLLGWFSKHISRRGDKFKATGEYRLYQRRESSPGAR